MSYVQNRIGNSQFASLPQAMASLLRAAVGGYHWSEAYRHYERIQQLPRHPTQSKPRSETSLGEDASNYSVSELRGKAAFIHFVLTMADINVCTTIV